MPAGVTLTRVDWYEYVLMIGRAAGDETQQAVAGKIGVHQSTVSRWQIRDPDFRDVVKFAKHYEIGIPEAIVRAYGVSWADLEQQELSVDGLPSAVLLAQLVSRMHVRVDDLYQALGENHPSREHQPKPAGPRRKS